MAAAFAGWTGTAAAADPERVAEGERLDRLGKTHYKAERFEDAAAAFEAAFDADPKPRFLFNLGRAEERLGRYPQAVRHVRRYLEEGEDDADDDEVEALLAILEVKLRKAHGKVEILSKPQGALVQLRSPDHSADGQTPYSDWLPFGRYNVTVLQADHAPATQRIEVAWEAPVRLELTLRPSVVAPRSEPSAAPAWGTWATLGAGAALLVVGGAFAVMSQEAVDERDALVDASREPGATSSGAQTVGLQDDAERHAMVANVSLASGGLALIVGGLMLGGVF